MQEKLIIYLHANNLLHPSWIMTDSNGLVVESVYQGDPSLLSLRGIDKIVKVVIPAQDVLLTTIAIQKMSRAKLLQALPFALEEQLIDEVEALHFAIGPYLSNGKQAVAVIAQAKMNEWLNLLISWAITPHEMMSAVFLLPHTADIWYAMVLDQLFVMRRDVTGGLALDLNNLMTTLPSILTEVPLEQLPKQVVCQGDVIFNSINFPNQILLSQKKWNEASFLEQLAPQCVSPPVIELLQGAYAVKRPHFWQTSALIKTILSLSVAWILLILIYPMVSYALLSHKVNETNQQIEQIYYYHFPQSRSVIDPKRRMSDKLQKMKSEINNQPIFKYFTHVAQAFDKNIRVEIKRIDYQTNQMLIELIAPNSTTFSAFVNFLSQSDLTVKQQNASFNNAQINATLLIE